jgi:hypothetical protein
MAKSSKLELHTLIPYRHAVELMARTLLRAENMHVKCYKMAYATSLFYIYNVPCADAAADLQKFVVHLKAKEMESESS